MSRSYRGSLGADKQFGRPLEKAAGRIHGMQSADLLVIVNPVAYLRRMEGARRRAEAAKACFQDKVEAGQAIFNRLLATQCEIPDAAGQLDVPGVRVEVEVADPAPGGPLAPEAPDRLL